MEIRITCDYFELHADLKDTPTARAIYASLPIEATVQKWGGEVYFRIAVDMPLDETAQEELEPGTLAYWPTGQAFCIFFGQTPASKNSEPRAYSPVNIVGTIQGNINPLNQLWDGDSIKINKKQ